MGQWDNNTKKKWNKNGTLLLSHFLKAFIFIVFLNNLSLINWKKIIETKIISSIDYLYQHPSYFSYIHSMYSECFYVSNF